jgi:hypothetical protein
VNRFLQTLLFFSQVLDYVDNKVSLTTRWCNKILQASIKVITNVTPQVKELI